MKTKVLFLAANPHGTNHLNLDEEIRAITKKIRDSDYRDTLELVSEWAVRTDDLLLSLNQHKPHIVHFSGHGLSKGIMLIGNDREPKIVDTAAVKALFTTLPRHLRMPVKGSPGTANAGALRSIIAR